uniref:Uncharacterized protein n=1 Tax=Arundo donax TaxID=35708 RepID=A0A0A8Z1N6_ARUDO
MTFKQFESSIKNCRHLPHRVYFFEFRGEVLGLEQIHRDLLEIDLVHPAEDDDGAGGLRPPVGVNLDGLHSAAWGEAYPTRSTLAGSFRVEVLPAQLPRPRVGEGRV